MRLRVTTTYGECHDPPRYVSCTRQVERLRTKGASHEKARTMMKEHRQDAQVARFLRQLAAGRRLITSTEQVQTARRLTDPVSILRCGWTVLAMWIGRVADEGSAMARADILHIC